MQTASTRTWTPSHQRGFTLGELMVTLAVIGVLMTVGVPSMRMFAQNNRLTAAANDLLRSFQLARSESVKRQQTVIVCASSDPKATNPTCSYGAFRGWIVAQDTNSNWQVDGTDEVIERHELVDTSVTVKTDRDGIESFNRFGFANPDGTKNGSRNVVFCDVRGNKQVGTDSVIRAVQIHQTGRARVTRLYSEMGSILTAVGGSCP